MITKIKKLPRPAFEQGYIDGMAGRRRNTLIQPYLNYNSGYNLAILDKQKRPKENQS
jgi:ribosome modulation factor